MYMPPVRNISMINAVRSSIALEALFYKLILFILLHHVVLMTSCCRFTFNVSDWKWFCSSFRRFLHNPINHLWMRKVCAWELITLYQLWRHLTKITHKIKKNHKITVVNCHVQASQTEVFALPVWHCYWLLSSFPREGHVRFSDPVTKQTGITV